MAAKMGFEGSAVNDQVKLGDSLWEIHAAGMKIVEFTAGRTEEQFQSEPVLRSAAEAMVTIMLRALLDVQTAFPAEYQKLPAADQMVRPQLESDRWPMVRDTVPELVAEVRVLLEQWHQG